MNSCSFKGSASDYNEIAYHLSHVCCSRIDIRSDGIVIENELVNVVVVEIQANRLDQWWHEEAQTKSNAQ